MLLPQPPRASLFTGGGGGRRGGEACLAFITGLHKLERLPGSPAAGLGQ